MIRLSAQHSISKLEDNVRMVYVPVKLIHGLLLTAAAVPELQICGHTATVAIVGADLSNIDRIP